MNNFSCVGASRWTSLVPRWPRGAAGCLWAVAALTREPHWGVGVIQCSSGGVGGSSGGGSVIQESCQGLWLWLHSCLGLGYRPHLPVGAEPTGHDMGFLWCLEVGAGWPVGLWLRSPWNTKGLPRTALGNAGDCSTLQEGSGKTSVSS